jgi:hypothetical protein
MASDELFEDDDLIEEDDDLGSDDESEGDDAEGDEEAPVAVVVDASGEDDLEDDANDSDVELALDEVLAERVKVVSDEDDEDEPVTPSEDSSDLGESVLPQQDDEFRCVSCRLLKKKSQLAKTGDQICRDCV